MKSFEAKTRAIFRRTCPYRERGIVDPAIGKADPQSVLRMRYADFAGAQKLIIEELQAIMARKRDLDTKLQAARKNKQRMQVTYFERALGEEKVKEIIIRKLADSIAWQLVDGRTDFIQWLYSSENPPAIDESNLQSVLEEVNRLNEEEPLSFALITDLTSFIRVGDILRRDTSGIIKIIEVKEGKKNLEALQIVKNELMSEGDELSLANLKQVYDPYLMGQVNRIRKQIAKGNRVREIINTGKGQDPQTCTPVIVQEPQRKPGTYTKELVGQLLSLDKDPWAYTIIEGCLMIGCYKGLMKKAGISLLTSLAQTFFQKNFYRVNLRQGLEDPMCEPIFIKPFREEDIFDIIFDRTRVFLVLNMDSLIEAFTERGAKARWLSRRETTKLCQQSKSKHERPVVFKDRAISIENDKWSLFLAGGTLRRIFFDNLLPSSVVSMLLDSLDSQI